MTSPTHCIGIDLGTSTTKIVIRDLEFDEVRPVTYSDGRAVVLPSFTSLAADKTIYISHSAIPAEVTHWRFENIKGKILFKGDFLPSIEDDMSVLSLLEGRRMTEIKCVLRHYRCLLTLKLAYWMSRVLAWSGLDSERVIWSLPLPVSSAKSYYALLVQDSTSKAIDFVAKSINCKPYYCINDYIEIFELFEADPVTKAHPQLQTLPEGICNIVACAASSFRRTDRFAVADIGASTAEFLAFSFELQQLDVFHSTTLPIGVEALRARSQLWEESGRTILSEEAVGDYWSNVIKTLIAPRQIQPKFYNRTGSVEFCLCGGGSLIDSVRDAFSSIPENRLRGFALPNLVINGDLSAITGYEGIPAYILPRYLVACGLSVPLANFVRYRLPEDLVGLYFVEYQQERGGVMDRYLGPSTDNWDYTAYK